ncbi:unnamed protein product [Spirodela intermedia]|uniref:Uncharacterized protein n=1 Tax=Spirodela intermedia TaxID=51605 RepID=A0A7I8IS64_SPIIN|nr:unnamed protein product [Spirodela intermedia]CAA6660694.1 unnamed protein product [Spirodela intermedia]
MASTEMEKQLFLAGVVFIALLITGRLRRQRPAAPGETAHPPQKLFVFGDSYADTGNIAKLFSPSWKPPYGLPSPRSPSAASPTAGSSPTTSVSPSFPLPHSLLLSSFLGIRSPIPYKYRKFGKKLLPYGMNFAVGGTGVFDTGNFQRTSLSRSTTSSTMIRQLALDLRKIRRLGVAKVAVTNLHPIGCIPSIASSFSYRKCNETTNIAVMYHNGLLAEAVAELNKNPGGAAEPFVIIDLFSAFKSVLIRGKPPPLLKHMMNSSEALRPCCEAANGGFGCGSTDENGAPKYTVCKDPGSKFYWDSVHPSQAGWAAVVSFLGNSLRSLLP